MNKLLDKQELERFVNEFFNEQMEKLHIPGAVFTLVKDGKILFTKGYGYKNLKTKEPVIPDKTIFRAGSVSKVFTATAIMQLVEKNILNLNEDINKYTKRFQIETKFQEPVTLKNLLTHTGGFGDIFVGGHVRKDSDRMPLGDYLATRMPPQSRASGEIISYSDHGMALAGYIVEEMTGIPFAQYIEEKIFQPLDMHTSSFDLPKELFSNLAVGYRYKNGQYKQYEFDYTNIAPSADLHSTAMDMARFMIAHLQGGQYNGKCILNEETIQEMHSQQATNYPKLAGRTLGFAETTENKQRVIFHGGAMPGFTCQLSLIPEQNLGFFIAWNNTNPSFASLFTRKFFDYFYPIEEKTIPKEPLKKQTMPNRFSGSYRYTRYSKYTFEKISTLFQQIRVKKNRDGFLNIGRRQVVKIEPKLFQYKGANTRVAFKENVRGQITYLFIERAAYERVSWLESSKIQLSMFGMFSLIFLAISLLSCLRILGSQFLSTNFLSHLLIGLIGVLNLGFLIGFIGFFLKTDPYDLLYGKPPVLVALLILPRLSFLLTVGLVFLSVWTLISTSWSIVSQIYYLLLILIGLAFSVFLRYWNLLRYRF